jgi:hypothetical protein
LNGESVDHIANLDVVLPQGAIVDVLLAVPIMGG